MAKVETLLKITTYLCALSGFAAVLRYLDPSYIACFTGLAAIAVFIDFRKTVVLPRWLLNLLCVFVLLPSAFRIGPELIVEPVLNGLVLLMGIKLLENKKPRDYMQIYLICIFLLIGSTLLSFSILFLLYFFCLFSLCTLALLLLCYFSKGEYLLISSDNALKLLYQALLICGFSIPACALFFVILPRTDYPLFDFMHKSALAKSGFADSVSLGDVAEIQEDSGVAFRAAMNELNIADLFWRGIELDLFDGRSWKRGAGEDARWGEWESGIWGEWESGIWGERGMRREGDGQAGRKIPEFPNSSIPQSQTIYLEPYENRRFFALDRPVAIYPEKIRRWKKQTAWNENIQERIRYKAISIPTGFVHEKGIDTERYLQLPADFSPRIAELSQKLTEGETGTDAIREFMQYFHSALFEYSLKSLPESQEPLDQFIFESRRGNCEYFASALGAMLRSVGIPARLIGGYRGGYYNRAGSYYLVLHKNAHVWVEAYVSEGWIRLDPTPVPAPGQGLSFRHGIILQAELLFDTFNYYWEKLVISYDLSEQFALWRKLKEGIKTPAPDWRRVRKSLEGLPGRLPALALIALCIIVFLRSRGKPEEKLASGFVRKMARRGYRKGAGEGLEEFVQRIGDPDLRKRAANFVADYQDDFYRDRKFSRELIKRLKSCIRQL